MRILEKNLRLGRSEIGLVCQETDGSIVIAEALRRSLASLVQTGESMEPAKSASITMRHRHIVCQA